MQRPAMLLTTLVVAGFAAPLQAQQDRLAIYGFFDLEYEASNADPDETTHTFDQHHFNVITTVQLDPQWRVFGEVEWEHGVSLTGSGGSGLVALERAWVEYAHSDGFKLKLGKFLPPFGIYNLLHDASPTFLSVFLPSSVYGTHANTTGGKQRLYAKFGTGIQALGTLGSDWAMDYYAYVTNGRGPEPGGTDNNQDKGIGGRLQVTSPDDALRLGVSYYQDNNGTANDTRQTALAADATFTASGFTIEAEGFIPRLENVTGAGIPNDSFRSGWGSYVQASYLTSADLTPFARWDKFDPDTDADMDSENDIVLGLFYRLTSSTVLKAQVHFLSFDDTGKDSFERFVSAIAVAF